MLHDGRTLVRWIASGYKVGQRLYMFDLFRSAYISVVQLWESWKLKMLPTNDAYIHTGGLLFACLHCIYSLLWLCLGLFRMLTMAVFTLHRLTCLHRLLRHVILLTCHGPMRVFWTCEFFMLPFIEHVNFSFLDLRYIPLYCEKVLIKNVTTKYFKYLAKIWYLKIGFILVESLHHAALHGYTTRTNNVLFLQLIS